MSRRRLRYAAAGLAMALLLALSAPVASAAQTVPARPVLEYKGESGVRIVSYSTRWNTREQLKALHDELLNNFHSEELAYLDAVILYPGEAPDGVAGRWRGDWTKRGDGPWQLNPGRIIELYRADEITSLDLMARTLSHEYGHHFTSYWLLKHEGLLFRDWRKTEWARIRGLSNFPQVGSGYHSWEPQEIAAEDYIQLFGSPLAREALVRNVPMGDGRYIPAEIQENAAIPLAWDTPGLYEYWRKALGPAAPAPCV